MDELILLCLGMLLVVVVDVDLVRIRMGMPVSCRFRPGDVSDRYRRADVRIFSFL
jgi:hypothetical protein